MYTTGFFPEVKRSCSVGLAVNSKLVLSAGQMMNCKVVVPKKKKNLGMSTACTLHCQDVLTTNY